MKIGERVENFSLPDAEENTVHLSDFTGKWVVLYFYPKDSTPGCTTEALEFTSLVPEFEKHNAVVIGISADSCQSHQKFAVKFDLGIILLSDPEKKVLKRFNAFGPKTLYGKLLEGIIRSTALINPAQELAFYWNKVKAKGHAQIVLDKISELQQQS
jgi:peroxiredoxin Q/BCP